MKLMRFTAFVFFLYVQISFCRAQEAYDITYEDAALKTGIQISPNGYGLFVRNSKPLSNGYSRCLEAGFTNIRDLKEKSVLNQRMVNATPYVYGKVNRLYALRPMYGIQKTLAERHDRNSFGISAFMLAGPAIGFLKPVYVDIEIADPQIQGSTLNMSVRYDPEIQRQESVVGYSGFWKGTGKTRIVPGISVKSGVEFNWGNYGSEFWSAEAGFIIDCFPGRPEIMHGIKNRIIYSSFYLSFAFGKNY